MKPPFSTLTVRVMITHRLCYFRVSTPYSKLFMLLTRLEPKNSSSNLCCILVIVVMAPVVRLEPNVCWDLLSHDDVIEDLKSHGWDVFFKKFEHYNLQVAKAFAQTFDGCRAKIGDTQLELSEKFVRKAIGLPSKGETWFKNT